MNEVSNNKNKFETLVNFESKNSERRASRPAFFISFELAFSSEKDFLGLKISASVLKNKIR